MSEQPGISHAQPPVTSSIPSGHSGHWQAVAARFSLPLLDLDAIDPSILPLAGIDPALVRKHQVLPLVRRGSRLFVGVADPAAEEGLQAIRFHTGREIVPVVVEADKLGALIGTVLDGMTGLDCEFAGLAVTTVADGGGDESEDPATPGEADEAPVTRFVHKILLDAIRRHASDIHIEPYETTGRIRFREDGVLREIAHPPLAVAKKIGARLKVMARLDIAERRLPQDGRFKLKLSRSRAVDFRVSTLPTLWGEKTVLRLLDSAVEQLDLEVLGFSEEQKLHFTDALHRPQGLVLVTGPTGSGKSFTLYAGLSLLNTGERNIATVEDPVEIHLDGINQVAVNLAVGLDFNTALRAFLRQDPDVLMVGEIRDPKTAEIAVKAAQTGHLVLSTLHTNSAAETLARLADMGIPSYHIATSLSLLIAQRLLRRLCHHCKRPVTLPARTLMQEGFTRDQADKVTLYAAGGCDRCHGGYRGRVGIYETLPITEAVSRVIMSGGNSIQIADYARNTGLNAGLNTLRQAALEQAATGVTSLAEVNRITRTLVWEAQGAPKP